MKKMLFEAGTTRQRKIENIKIYIVMLLKKNRKEIFCKKKCGV